MQGEAVQAASDKDLQTDIHFALASVAFSISERLYVLSQIRMMQITVLLIVDISEVKTSMRSKSQCKQ